MKNRAHAGHLFGRSRVELCDLAVGDRRLNRNGIEQSGKMEVGGILRHAAHLQRPVDARSFATDRRCLCSFSEACSITR